MGDPFSFGVSVTFPNLNEKRFFSVGRKSELPNRYFQKKARAWRGGGGLVCLCGIWVLSFFFFLF